jgi:multiple sugar transport system permease protein
MKRLLETFLLLLLVAVQSIPLLWMLVTSTQRDSTFVRFNGSRVGAITASHFTTLFQATTFPQWCVNTLLIAAASAALAAISGNLFSFALRFRSGQFYRNVRNLAFLAYLIPSMFLILPLEWVVPRITTEYIPLLMPFIYQIFLFPLCVWIAAGFVDRIPTGVIRTAQLDELPFSNRLRWVYIPYAARGFWVAFVLCFVIASQEYIYAFTFLTRPGWQTLPIGIANMQAGDVYQWALISAAGVCSAALALFLLFFARSALTVLVERLRNSS